MKTLSVLLAILFLGVNLTTIAQYKNDSVEATEIFSNEETLLNLRSKASMGYHHSNYKHPAKADKVRHLYLEKGHTRNKVVIFSYKMPFSNIIGKLHTDKTIVTPTSKHKIARNYKQPYSN